jgi:hypothetical protein
MRGAIAGVSRESWRLESRWSLAGVSLESQAELSFIDFELSELEFRLIFIDFELSELEFSLIFIDFELSELNFIDFELSELNFIDFQALRAEFSLILSSPRLSFP